MGQSVLPPTPGLSYKREYFAASSTFTLPMTAQNKFDAILVSGGGGGGRSINTSNSFFSMGGGGGILYVTEVYCLNGTTLTITVGGGGAGAPAPGSTSYAAAGTASSISGITGNGVSTTISSPAGFGGRSLNKDYNSVYAGNNSNVVSWRFGSTANNSDKFSNAGSGFGSFQRAMGTGKYGESRNIFQTKNGVYSGGNRPINDTTYITGGPIPLLGNYLHSSVGGTGTAGTVAGSGSTANSFFGGMGGTNSNNYQTVGVGGGGGSGGRSTTGGTLGGTGGNGSTNSGGGGGAGGKNTATISNTGAGGNGGSGFIIIGYWG